MFDVFKYLSDLTARAHMLEGTINKKTGKFYTKEEIPRALGIIGETCSNPEPEPDDEIKEDEQ